MDNFTLLSALVITAGINVILTYIISGKIDDNVGKRWRISSVFFFLGAFLLLSQTNVPYWISLIIGNYLYILGVYFQISSVLYFENKKFPYEKHIIALVTISYSLGFYYYTLVEFNTLARILIVSYILSLLYLFSVLYVLKAKEKIFNLISRDIWVLFMFSGFFYFSRALITLIEYMNEYWVSTLFDKDLLTSITFLFLISYNAIFLGGMFNSTLKERNLYINKEKKRLVHLFDFLNDTAKHLELKELYQSIENVLRKSFGVRSGAIYLKNEDENYSLDLLYHFNDLNLPTDNIEAYKRGPGLSGQSIEKKQVVIVDIDNYPDEYIAEEYKKKGVTHVVSIPLKASNKIIGTIYMVYSIEIIDEELFDKNFLTYLGDQIALVLQNAILYEKINETANIDFLTGLYNRRKIQEFFNIEQKKINRSNSKLTIALIDLDHFKKINDTYGHEYGDEVLKCMANILKSSCRETDYICRWGGEEFLVVFADTTLSQANIIAERIRKKLHNTMIKSADMNLVTASIGLAEINSIDETLDEITIRADRALYEAKNNGRNKVYCSKV